MVDFLTESKYQSNGATKKNIHPATSFRMEWLCLMTYLIIESRINIEGAMLHIEKSGDEEEGDNNETRKII